METQRPNKGADQPPQVKPGQEQRDVPDKQIPESEPPRRYDEADPTWRNPDVQMQNPQVESPNLNG